MPLLHRHHFDCSHRNRLPDTASANTLAMENLWNNHRAVWSFLQCPDRPYRWHSDPQNLGMHDSRKHNKFPWHLLQHPPSKASAPPHHQVWKKDQVPALQNAPELFSDTDCESSKSVHMAKEVSVESTRCFQAPPAVFYQAPSRFVPSSQRRLHW